MSIVARYPGRCGICQEPIHEGDEIDEVDGEWAHADCVDDEREEEAC